MKYNDEEITDPIALKLMAWIDRQDQELTALRAEHEALRAEHEALQFATAKGIALAALEKRVNLIKQSVKPSEVMHIIRNELGLIDRIEKEKE
jgi:hypothetical protein